MKFIKLLLTIALATFLTAICEEYMEPGMRGFFWIYAFFVSKFVVWYFTRGRRSWFGGFSSGGRSYSSASYDCPGARQEAAAREAERQRAYEHRQAQEKAAYMEYLAREAQSRAPNSYGTYQKQNRAQAARNEANRR